MSMWVMTYNILNGGEKRESYILEVIQTAKRDVVILQEVYTDKFLKFLSEQSLIYRVDIESGHKVTVYQVA